MRVKEADLVKRISDLEIENNILEENLHHLHEKINQMYEHMSTLTAGDWKAEGNWDKYKLIIESMHHVTSEIKGEKEKQITDTRDRRNQILSCCLIPFIIFYDNENHEYTPSVNVI